MIERRRRSRRSSTTCWDRSERSRRSRCSRSSTRSSTRDSSTATAISTCPTTAKRGSASRAGSTRRRRSSAPRRSHCSGIESRTSSCTASPTGSSTEASGRRSTCRARSRSSAAKRARASTRIRGRGTRSASAAQRIRAATPASAARISTMARPRSGRAARPTSSILLKTRAREGWIDVLKGSLRMPKDNDSPFLLDKHKRGLQNLDRMAHYREGESVDLLVVGAGAGGLVLAQRLARAGWRVVVLEKGPFWDPDRDWVSDEKAAGPIYWTDERIISGAEPIEMGKNNSGVGVGGSMTHFAGYVPRLHPSDFVVRTRDGVGADWPISYWDLKESFERIELELPVAGQDWPWGDPHSYPHAPHPIAGAAAIAWAGAREYGIEMRVGPVSITNGVFGNRPHCIYRGFCLQGCKVNAKASPLIT